jgi:hypothetical protein
MKWYLFDFIRTAPELQEYKNKITITDLTDSVDALFDRLLLNVEVADERGNRKDDEVSDSTDQR